MRRRGCSAACVTTTCRRASSMSCPTGTSSASACGRHRGRTTARRARARSRRKRTCRTSPPATPSATRRSARASSCASSPAASSPSASPTTAASGSSCSSTRRSRSCSFGRMFEVRPCADQDEYGRAIGAIGQYFNPPPSEEFLERWATTLPHERMHAAFEDGQIVGGAGAFPFELSVPGGSLPCAGVTAVGVHPTHRRRGVLRSMMDAQLCDVHERGEPIAALWASEETIYGRFGYGIASWAGELQIQHEWDAFAEPLELAGTTRFVTPEEALELFPPIYDAVRRERPGMTSRSETWWQNRQLRMPEDEASAPRRFVVLELDGEPAAYAIYRTHFSFGGGSA